MIHNIHAIQSPLNHLGHFPNSQMNSPNPKRRKQWFYLHFLIWEKQVWKENNNSALMVQKQLWNGSQETLVCISHLSHTKDGVLVNLSSSPCWYSLLRSGKITPISMTCVTPERGLNLKNIFSYIFKIRIWIIFGMWIYWWNTIQRKT